MPDGLRDRVDRAQDGRQPVEGGAVQDARLVVMVEAICRPAREIGARVRLVNTVILRLHAGCGALVELFGVVRGRRGDGERRW